MFQRRSSSAFETVASQACRLTFRRWGVGIAHSSRRAIFAYALAEADPYQDIPQITLLYRAATKSVSPFSLKVNSRRYLEIAIDPVYIEAQYEIEA